MEDVVFLYGCFSEEDNEKDIIPKQTIIEKEKIKEDKRVGALKLREMLWEITSRCNKGCHYCGSKDTLNQKELSKDEYDFIVENILAYPPEEITLTGGEPSLCYYFPEAVKKLSKKMAVKVVSNGSIFELEKDVLEKLSRIGLSINTLEDIEALKNETNSSVIRKMIDFKSNITMITNFGTHNIFNFDQLFKKFKDNYDYWQIQLTMGDLQLQPDGIKYLRDKIASTGNMRGDFVSINNNQRIVLSDDLQYEHSCTAGLRSCSITYDGKIIPCLSERGWGKELRVQGSLLDTGTVYRLKEIWETQFHEQRFGCSSCCRDCIKYPQKDISSDYNEKFFLQPLYQTQLLRHNLLDD